MVLGLMTQVQNDMTMCAPELPAAAGALELGAALAAFWEGGGTTGHSSLKLTYAFATSYGLSCHTAASYARAARQRGEQL